MPTYRLDDYFAEDQRPVRALVVTVNNYELEVLRGATNLLRRTEFIIYQSIHHPQIKEYLSNQSFDLVSEVYSGPPGGKGAFIALYKSRPLETLHTENSVQS